MRRPLGGFVVVIGSARVVPLEVGRTQDGRWVPSSVHVPQRLQAFEMLVGLHPMARRRRVLGEPGREPAELADDTGELGVSGHVAPLFRISTKVEELHRLMGFESDRPQELLSSQELWIELTVEPVSGSDRDLLSIRALQDEVAPKRDRSFVVEKISKGLTAPARRTLDSDHLENQASNVTVVKKEVAFPTGVYRARELDDEGEAGHVGVQAGVPVCDVHSTIQEVLTVIREKNHQAAIVEISLLQRTDN